MEQVTDKVDLIQSIRKVTVIIFAIGTVCFAAIGLFDRFSMVENETKKIKSEYTDKQKQIIRTQVESAVRFIKLAKESGVSRKDIIGSVRKIRFGEGHDGYIFIVTYYGTTLLNDTQRELEGKDIWDLADPNGVKVIQEERRAVRNPDGDFIYYSWYQPSTGLITPKVSFIKGIPEWEWMVGSGVYLDSVEVDIAILKEGIIKDTVLMVIILSAVLFFLLFIIRFIFNKFTGTVAAEIKLFSSYFDYAAANNLEIDITNIQYQEFSSIAEDMNIMVKNKLKSDHKIFTSEQRLLMQRDQSPVGYVEYDLDVNFIYWNPAAEKIFGYFKEEILGRSDEIIVPPEILTEVRGIFRGLKEVDDDRNNGINGINENITKDGRRITCEWYNKALIDQNGSVTGFIALVNDITERKLIEDQLQESLEEKKILLQEVHHRVKNNMAIISSFLSLQSMNIEDEYVRSLLQSSENRVKSMALIHENLYKSENLKDINIQTYIDELVTTLLDSYGYGAADISTKITINQFELELDLLVPLGMLINEIISNALKHAYNNIDSPELSISLVNGRQSELVLTIKDNGIGLPEDNHLDQIDSIGFLLINGLVQQIDSKMEIYRKDGTEYKITVPVK